MFSLKIVYFIISYSRQLLETPIYVEVKDGLDNNNFFKLTPRYGTVFKPIEQKMSHLINSTLFLRRCVSLNFLLFVTHSKH